MKTTICFLGAVAAAFAQAPATTPPATPPAPEPGLYATINTSMGAIKLKLFEKEAPITVKNFVALARGTKPWKDPKTGQMVTRPLYPGTTFHRVIPKFMIQGGDPAGNGEGDVGFTIPEEIVPDLKFDVAGRLGMARTEAPHSGASQFFITDGPTAWLNGGYTIFGQVIEGQDVVHKIISVPTGKENKPITPVKITSVVIKRVGPPPAAPATKKGSIKKG